MRDITAPKSPLLVTVLQLGLLLVAVYYTFIGGQTAQGIYDPVWRLITQWFTSLLVGSWLVGRLVGRVKIPRTPLDFPLTFLLMAWLLATIFSANRVYSQEALVFFVTYLFFFYLAADGGRWPWVTELVFNALIAVSGLVWTLGVWQFWQWYQAQAVTPFLWQLLPRLSVLGNPNLLGSYIALALPLTIYKITTVRYPFTRLLLAIWVVMLLATGLLSQSRGGLVAMLVAVMFYMGVWVWQTVHTPGQKKLGDKDLRRLTRIFILLVAFGGMLTWLVIGWRGLAGGADIRRQVIAGALQSWEAHPLLRAGPGVLGEELLRYQQPLDVIWADAHNLYITLLAETGLVGAVGVLWLVGAALKIGWRALRQADRTPWCMSSMACAGGLLGFAAHNMADSLFKFPLIMLMVAVLAGFWLSPYLSHPPAKLWSRLLTTLAILILIAQTVVGVSDLQNIRAYNQGVNAAAQGDWSTALAYVKLADQLAPNMPFYQRQVGFAAGYVAEQQPDYRAEAIANYQAAFNKVDTLAIDHANLACLLWADGQQTVARQEMSLASHLQTNHFLYHLNLGYYLEKEGDYPAAWTEYAQVIAYRPDLLSAGYWRQNQARAAALPEITRQAVQKLTEAGADGASIASVYFYAGDVERALQVYDEGAPQNSTEVTALSLGRAKTLWALGRLAEAKSEWQRALPLSEAYVYLSKMALTENDLPRARQYVAAALSLETNDDILYRAGWVAEARYQAGRVAEVGGEAASAIQFYETTLDWYLAEPDTYYLSRYATEVARRQPWPVNYLPCLVQIYPTPLLVSLTEAEGNLLEQQGNYTRAAQVYRRLLRYEPANVAISAKLTKLCQYYPEICFP